jgi:hypothetical protein
MPRALTALLLPLLAEGGWEGVKLLIFVLKSDPTPTLPCKHGREKAGLPCQPNGGVTA